MDNLNMKLVKVHGKTRSDLVNALTELAQIDADFIGENGPDYLWDEVDASKYDSNMAYLFDALKDIKNDQEFIAEFIARWINADNYYHSSVLDVIYDEQGNAECIALATTS